MPHKTYDEIVFLTLVRDDSERLFARLMIESLRSFGGAFAQYPIWLFDAAPRSGPGSGTATPDAQVMSLDVPSGIAHYPFADKVCACAEAERLAAPHIHSLVWIDPQCLVVRPPLLWSLGQYFDAAVRPVHIRNVGLAAGEPPDGFWNVIYEMLGVKDIETTVDTFVDGQHIRSYFNSHAFAIKPTTGLLRRSLECFRALAGDGEFQRTACQDPRHRIFLHQAIWSALLATSLEPERLRLLPPDYNYPYNLHSSVPPERRAVALNDLTSIAYEDRSLDPDAIDDIEVREPLRSWLAAHWRQSADTAGGVS